MAHHRVRLDAKRLPGYIDLNRDVEND